MLYRKPRVGQELNAYCGKCKEERTHIVAAMDGEVVRRVTCSMCGGTHNYKLKPAAPANGETAPAAAPAKRRGGSRRAKDSESFNIDPKRPVKSYDMNNIFSAGDVINHPKFGLGAVEVTLPPNKIEVRFQEGKKLLLHNMKNFRY
ncbi:MAG TPA: hypothetical protein VLM38_22300 [Blastocatellia bacterium]|nr:hypothetical protein [Blastocatellia bacterium]